MSIDAATPRDLVQSWVDAFNRADAAALADFYAEDAINHQVAEPPVHGRAAIQEMFAAGFASATMVCIVENIFQDGEWAILEWRDPLGLRGCGFFHVVRGKIVLQRGYWDTLSFLRLQGLPMPTDPLSPSYEPADRQVMIVELAGLIRDPSNDPLQPLRSPTL